MKSFLAILAIAFCLSWTTPCYASFENESISMQTQGIETIKQGPAECGPASVFNALLLGNTSLKRAILDLPGITIEEKYRFAINTYAYKPSEFFGGNRLRLDDFGMAFEDIRWFALDLLNSKQNFLIGNVLPLQSETERAYITRVHDELYRSLAAGVPPVIAIGSVVDGIQLNLTHAVLATGVSAVSANNSFRLELVDPLGLVDHITLSPQFIPQMRLGERIRVKTQSSNGIATVREEIRVLSFSLGNLR